MTTIFQTHFPNVVAAATVSSRKQKDALTSTDQQGDRRRKRHKDDSCTPIDISAWPGEVDQQLHARYCQRYKSVGWGFTDGYEVSDRPQHTHTHWFSHNGYLSRAPGQRCSVANTSAIMLEGI